MPFVLRNQEGYQQNKSWLEIKLLLFIGTEYKALFQENVKGSGRGGRNHHKAGHLKDVAGERRANVKGKEH